MPLWKIYHPVNAFTAKQKQELAEKITSLYSFLPKFYVNVIFQAVPADDLYIGGKAIDNFVRITVEHIARSMSADRRVWWLKRVNEALASFIKDRGFRWELHVDETPRDLWTVQGYIPPPTDSDDEARWRRENVASPLTLDPMMALSH